MTLSYLTAIRNTRLNAITTAVGGSGLFRIYAGSAPANVNTALSGQTLLSTMTFNATFAPAASGGALTLNAISSDTNAANTGTATFFQACTSGGTAQFQGTVGTSGADLNLNTTSIVAGAQVSCSSFVITAGNP
jgi:hypothetical protein